MKYLGGAVLALIFSAFAARSVQALGANPYKDWQSADTAHFVVHFEAQDKAQAERLARIAERVYPKVTGLLHWQPAAKTEVVLLDAFDFANGYATPLPFNHTAIFLTPPDEGELLENSDWFELVFTHEFTHIVHLDKARGAPKFIRNILGRFPFLFPNAWQPTWAIEGLATWVESGDVDLSANENESNHYGRLGNSYYDALMRMEVSAGLKSLREINADGRAWPLSKSYLYGAYFYQFLTARYGQQAVYKFVEGYSDNILPFRVHSNPVAVTGKPMDILWDEYQQWLRSEFSAPKQAIPGQLLTDGEWQVDSPVQTRDGTVFFVEDKGYAKPRLIRIRKGVRDDLGGVESGTRLEANDDGSLWLTQPDICDGYDYFYGLSRWSETDGFEQVSNCSRIRAVASNGKQLAALSIEGGVFSIDLLDQNGVKQKHLVTAAADEVINAIDLSRDGRHLIYSRRHNGQWGIIEQDLTTNVERELWSDKAVKLSLRYSDNEQSAVFVSDYENTFNVWRILLGSDHGNTKLEQLTYSDGGVLEVAGLGANGIGAMTVMTEKGKAVSTLTDIKALDVKTIVATEIICKCGDCAEVEKMPRQLPPRSIATYLDNSALSNERDYSPWSSLLPRTWFPSGMSGDGVNAIGAQIFGQDTLGVHQYTAAPMAEVGVGEALGYLQYGYNNRHFITVARELESLAFHENENEREELDAYRLRTRAQWISLQPFWKLDSRLTIGLGAALDRERDVVTDDKNAGGVVQDAAVAGVFASFDSRREFVRSLSETNGMLLMLQAESYEPLSSDYFGEWLRAEWRGALNLGPTIIAGRLLAVRADAQTESNNLGGVFSEPNYGVPLFNQRQFALRGYERDLPELSGHNLNLASVEWRLPLADIDRHFMVPPLGINRLSLTAFYDVGDAWCDETDTVSVACTGQAKADYVAGAGVELMAEIKIGYRLGAELRLGYAQGLDEVLGERQVYLQLGRAF